MNVNKSVGQRLRDRIIGMPFPPDRAEELREVAAAQYLSMAGFCRGAVLRELDRIKTEKQKTA